MFKPFLRGLAPAVLCAVVPLAQAQTATPTPHPQATQPTQTTPATPSSPPNARPDPLNAQASVPALVYRSSLTPARQADAEKPVTWREANDTVTRIGGWRTYLREAQAPDVAPAALPLAPAAAPPASVPEAGAKPQAKPVPAPGSHSGHKTP